MESQIGTPKQVESTMEYNMESKHGVQQWNPKMESNSYPSVESNCAAHNRMQHWQTTWGPEFESQMESQMKSNANSESKIGIRLFGVLRWVYMSICVYPEVQNKATIVSIRVFLVVAIWDLKLGLGTIYHGFCPKLGAYRWFQM